MLWADCSVFFFILKAYSLFLLSSFSLALRFTSQCFCHWEKVLPTGCILCSIDSKPGLIFKIGQRFILAWNEKKILKSTFDIEDSNQIRKIIKNATAVHNWLQFCCLIQLCRLFNKPATGKVEVKTVSPFGSLCLINFYLFPSLLKKLKLVHCCSLWGFCFVPPHILA